MEDSSSVAISLPFRFDAGGKVAVDRNVFKQAAARLATLVDTSPGERVMLPGYGTITHSLVFENDIESRAGEVASSITAAARVYDPDIIIRSVNTREADMTGSSVAVDVNFLLEDPVGRRTEHRATISVGGEVTEEEI